MKNTVIANRIRALLAKTEENGCTEAEAIAAADKARELMDKYQIDLGAVGMEAEGVTKETFGRGAFKGALKVKDMLQVRVADYCDCKAWKNRSLDTMTFFGLQSDAEFAHWLIDSLEAFVTRSAAAYLLGNPVLPTGFKLPKWEAEKAFVFGCVNRINERLRVATEARRQSMAGTGTSLVVVKGAIVAKAFDDLDLKLRAGGKSTRGKAFDADAFRAGLAAGDGASFGKPVNGNGAVLSIGR